MERERIEELIRIRRQLLSNSDYKALKHADGAMSDAEYAETRSQRQVWRDEINELEAQLDNLPEETAE